MSTAARRLLGACIVTHRYLGMLLGIVMLMWCMSGVVMMYVPYPVLNQQARLSALKPLDLTACCKLPAGLADENIREFELTMMGEVPLLRVHIENENAPQLIDLRDGRNLREVTDSQALQVAENYGAARGYAGHARALRRVQYDQWTVEGSFRAYAPLLLFTWEDPRAPVLYVSGRDGVAVQVTERVQRFWNWLGSVPHWLYFLSLRENPSAWTQVVVCSSLLGCMLTLVGLCLGCTQLLRMRSVGGYTPYTGIKFWHHVPGLFFGIFVLSWVASGLFSLNPWGFLLDEHPYEEPARLRGAGMDGMEVAALLQTLIGTGAAAHAVSVQSASLDGVHKLVLTDAAGARTRIGVQGDASSLSQEELDFIRRTLTRARPPAPPVLMSAGDTYYFAHHRERPTLPVYRFIADDAEKTRYYIDPLSGALLRKVTASSRAYRWLHEGLHRLDFIESRPLWDFLMLILMTGVIFVCTTGAIMSVSSWRKTLLRRR